MCKMGTEHLVVLHYFKQRQTGRYFIAFLFTLYVDELSHQLNNCKVGCHINNVCINHLFYADDLCLMAPSSMGLQYLINICANYGLENDILFNRSKYVCMVVKPSDRKNSTPLMYLNGVALEYVDRVKYLGVLLSQDMKDDADMNRHLRSFYARTTYCALGPCTGLKSRPRPARKHDLRSRPGPGPQQLCRPGPGRAIGPTTYAYETAILLFPIFV